MVPVTIKLSPSELSGGFKRFKDSDEWARWIGELYEPFVGRNVEWIIEPDNPTDEIVRVIADANGARLDCSGKNPKSSP